MLFYSSHIFSQVKDIVARPNDTTNKEAANAAISKALSRTEIQNLLRNLAKSPVPPINKEPGAMCYKVAAPADRIEYVCPIDGSKTLYTDVAAYTIDRDLRSVRCIIKGLNNPSITLDESEFCRKCHPKMEHPRLALVIKYSDDKKPLRIEGIYTQDAETIRELLSGSLIHQGNYDEQTPLKDYIKRLEDIFDVKAE